MNFKTFFGIEEKDVKHNCIVCQNYDLSLFSDKTSDGLFAKCAIIENVTIISLKNNFLAGDAVLYLKIHFAKIYFCLAAVAAAMAGLTVILL
jgi:hypothetical protein